MPMYAIPDVVMPLNTIPNVLIPMYTMPNIVIPMYTIYLMWSYICIQRCRFGRKKIVQIVKELWVPN